MRILPALILCGLLPYLQSHAQDKKSIWQSEIRLKAILDSVRQAPDDSARIAIHRRFTDGFQNLISQPGTFRYPFDSLRIISIADSPDGNLRIYSWNLPLAGGRNLWSGFIQMKEAGPEKFRIITLIDKSDSIADAPSKVLSAEEWYGARYFTIIPCKDNNGLTFYTLLGWHGISPVLSSRLIEILVAEPGKPVQFGLKVFCLKDKESPLRMIWKYSANATMILNYEEQQVTGEKTWKASKREFEYQSEKAPMIIVDRLVPLDPQLEGQYEYYVPAANILDGLVFRNGCWNYIEEVDARNPSDEKRTRKNPSKHE